MYEIQALVSLILMFTKQCRCHKFESIIYYCQFVRLLIPFVVAAAMLTKSPSVLRILLEGCRKLSGTSPSDNHILRV